MTFPTDPHHYDSIAGFDTSGLFNAGSFSLAALADGTAGVTIANALHGQSSVAAGIQLITAISADQGVSPILSLAAFGQVISGLDGNSADLTAVGAGIAAVLRAPVGGVTYALTDLGVAYNNGQLSYVNAIQIAIGIANAGTDALALSVARVLGQIASQQPYPPGHGEGGEGGGSARSIAVGTAIAASQAAYAGGTLAFTRFVALMFGLDLAVPDYRNPGETAALAAIGQDPARVTASLQMLAAVSATIDSSYLSSETAFIKAIANQGAVDLAGVLGLVHGSIVAGTLSAANALRLIVGLVEYSYYSTSGSRDLFSAEVLAQISGGLVSANDAVAAIGSTSGLLGAPLNADALLMDVAVATGSLNVRMAAARQIAALVDMVDPDFTVPSYLTTVANAITFIRARIGNGFGESDAAAMLSAVAALGGKALLAVGASLRGDVTAGAASGSDIVTALATGATALGLTPSQIITLLAGVGGSSGFQLQGNTGVYVANADLQQAAASAILSIAVTANLTAAQVAGAFVAALPDAATGGNVYWQEISRVLIEMATSGAADVTTDGFVGSVIAAYVGLGPVNVGSMTGLITSMVEVSQTLSTTHALGILIAMGGSGTAAVQVAVGQELALLATQNYLGLSTSVPAITSALTASRLTPAQAALLFAGIVANSSLATVGSAAIDALATLTATASSTVISAIDGAVSGSALTLTEALGLFANLAGRTSSTVQSAITTELLALVAPASVETSITTLVGVAAAGTLGVQVAVGREIAAFVDNASLTGARAIALVDAAVGANTLTAVQGLAVLTAFGAGDSGREALVQSEMASLIGQGLISLATTISTLQSLATSASADVAAVINDELALLVTDPATLAQTAGLGGAVQVAAAARAIAGLVTSDPTSAATILNGLAGRIETGSLTSAQATLLLLDIVAEGGAAESAAISTLAALATPAQGHATGDVGLSDVTAQVATMLAAGTLSGQQALDVLDSLIGLNAGSIRSAIAGAIGTSATSITIAQLDATVATHALSAANAIAILGQVAGSSSALQAAAISEIRALATDATTRSQAVDALAAIGANGDATIRAGGYAALTTLLTANTSLTAQAFADILPFAGSGDAGVRADAVTEIASLVADAGLSTATLISAIGDQLASSTAVLTTSQSLAVLVGVLGVVSAEADVFTYVDTVAATNHYSQQVPRPGFTAEAAIAAIATAYGADTSRIATTVQELRQLETIVGAVSFVGALSGAPVATQFIVLSNLLPTFSGDTATSATLINRLSAVLATMPASDAASAITSLLNAGSLSAAQAAQLAIGYYVSGSPAAFLTLAAGMPAATLVQGITDLAGTSAITPYAAQELLAVLGVAGTAPLQAAAALALAGAILAQSAVSTNLMSAFGTLIGAGVITDPQLVGLLSRMLLSRLDAVATLSPVISGEISDRIASGAISLDAALTNIAATAAGATPAGMSAVAGEIAAILATRSIESPRVVAAVAAAASGSSAPLAVADEIALLIPLAGLVGGDMADAAGRQIGAEVASGAIGAGTAGYAVYAGYLNGAVTAAQATSLAIGELAGGSVAAGQETVYELIAHGMLTATAAATALDAAVGSGAISAAAAIDVAAGLASSSLGPDPAVRILSTLLSDARITGAAAVAELGGFIGSTATTIPADRFMAIVTTVAATGSAAIDASIGSGLAELIANGRLTLTQASTGLTLAVDGSAAPVVAATLSFDAAVTMLIGMAGDTSAVATSTAVTVKSGTLLAALIGSNATRLSAAEAALGGAAAAGTLTASQVIGVYGGLANGGILAAQIGATLATLTRAGSISIYDLYRLHAMVSADSFVSVVAAAALTLSGTQGSSATERQTLAGFLDGVIGTGAGTVTVATSTSLIAAAASDLSVSSGLVAQLYGDMGLTTSDPVLAVAFGAQLALQVANGTISATDATANASVAMLAGMAEADRLQVANVSAGFRDAIYTALQARTTGSGTPTSVVASLTQLITVNALSVANGLDVLAQAAHRFGQSFALVAGNSVSPLLTAGTVTPSELQTALTDAGFGATEALVFLASTIDVDHINATTLLAGPLTSLTQVASASTADIQALVTALSQAMSLNGSALLLSSAQAIAALSVFGAQLDATRYAPIVALVDQLVTSGRTTAAAAYSTIGQTLLALAPSQRMSEAIFLAQIAQGLGETGAQFVGAIVTAASIGLGAGGAVSLLATLTLIDDPSFSAQSGSSSFYPKIGIAAGGGIAALVATGTISASQAIAEVMAVTGLSDDNRALILLSFGGAATATGQVVAGAALASLVDGGGTPDLDTEVFAPVTANGPLAVVLASMALNGSTAAAAIAASLFASAGQVGGSPAISALVAALGSATASGALTAAQEVQAIGLLAQGVHTNPSSFTHLTPANSETLRAGLEGELLRLVTSQAVSVNAAISALLGESGAGSAALRAGIGRLLAVLVVAGDTTAGAIITAIGASGLSAAAQVQLLTGAALSTPALASAFGTRIGALAATGVITAADTIAAVTAVDSAYGTGSLSAEANLLIAAVAAGGADLPGAAGARIGGLFARGLASAPVLASLDAATGVTLTASMTANLLAGMTATAPDADRLAIGAEIVALVNANKVTLTSQIDAIDQAIAAGRLMLAPATDVLVAIVAHAPASAVAVAQGLEGLVANQQVTIATVLAALYAAAGIEDRVSASPQTDVAIAAVIKSLVTDGAVTLADAASALNLAAGGHALSGAHGLAIALSVASLSGAAASAFGAELAALLADGLTATVLSQQIVAAVGAATLTASTAILFLASGAEAADPGSLVAAERASGSAFAALVNAQAFNPTQLVAGLRQLVSSGVLDAAHEAALIVATAPLVAASIDATALAGELTRLVGAGALSAPALFSTFEAVAGNPVSSGSAALIVGMAAAADATLTSGLIAELASLTGRGLIGATDLTTVITSAPIGADTADRLLAASLPPDAAGNGFAALITAGRRGVVDVLADLDTAAGAGAISRDAEIELIAAIAVRTTDSTSMGPLGAALTALVASGTLTAAQVFTDITAYATAVGSYSTALGQLIGSMSATADAALRSTIGAEINRLVATGALPATSALDAIIAGSGGSALSAAAVTTLLAMAANGSASIQTAVGLRFGLALNGIAGSATATALKAQLEAATSSGTLTAAQMAVLLSGLATASFTGDIGGSAVAGDIDGLILSGALTIDQARGFLASITSDSVRAFLAAFAQINAQQLSGALNGAQAQSQLSDLVHATYSASYQLGVTLNGLNALVATLGGLGSTSALARLNAIGTLNSQTMTQATATLSALEGSGLLAATQELTTLVSSGALTAAGAMQSVASGIGSLGPTKVIAWLADLSSVPSLSGAAIDALTALVTAGTITGPDLVTLIAGMTNQSTATIGTLATLSTASATALLIGLAGRGDGTTIDAAGQRLAVLVAAQQQTFTPAQILAAVDTAITAGRLTGAKGIRLFGDIVANSGAAAGTVLDYLTAHMPAYVSNGAFSLADIITVAFAFAADSTFQAQGPLAGAEFAGKLIDMAGGASVAINQIRAGVAGNALTAYQAAAALLGVVAQENAFRSVQLQTQPVTQTDAINARAAAAFSSVMTELMAMVGAGSVSGATVVTDLQLLGGLTTAQTYALLLQLAATGDTSTRAAVTAALVGMGTHWGPSSDPFFAGGLSAAAQDFTSIINGGMTVVAAIADVESYARANHVSTDAALVMLGSLLTQYDTATNPSSNRSNLVAVELSRRVAIGDMAAELAGRVAQGTTPLVTAFGAAPQAVDTTAISYTDAKALLTSAVNQYGSAHTSAEANFAVDVSISQIARTMSFNADSLAGHVQSELQRGLIYTGLGSTEINTINSSYSGGYAYDQALVALIGQLGSSTAATAGANAAQAIDLLGRRLMTGSAETDIVNQVANGSLSADQAISALDKLIAPTLVGYDASTARLMRQTALGWLAIKSAQYVEGNYQISTAADGTKTQTYLPSEVNTLYGELLGQNQNDVLTGLGALASIQNKSTVSSVDLATDFKVAQTILSSVATQSIQATTGGATLTDAAAIKGASDQASIDVSSASAFFESGWTQIQGVWNSTSGKPGLPGVLHDEVVAKPSDYRSYVDLGAQIASTGIPLIGSKLLKLPNLSDAIWNDALGEGASGVVAAVSIGSKVMGAILGINAVSNALGPAAPALRGVFNVTGATADLLSNIVSGVVISAANTYANAAVNLGSSVANLATGDFSSLQTSAADTAEALFTLSSGGFTPESLGAVASSAGEALLDLASGNPADAGKAAVALGQNIVKALTQNVYFVAAKDAVLRYADTIANDLFSAAQAAVDFFDNLIHNPTVSSPQTLIRDLGSVAAKGFKDPSSTSNYGDFYHGSAIDGYLTGATVFVDTNGNGILDAGEYSTTTDSSGAYSLPAGLSGSIVITGGTDSSTGLANTATYAAPNGSTVISPLTTLVQSIVQASGGSSASAVTAANAAVSTALGLGSATDLLTLDTEAGILQGDATATAAFRAGVALANIFSLVQAVGGTTAGQSVYSTMASIIAGGGTVDLTDGTAVTALATSLAVSAGLSATAASAVGEVAGVSTSALSAELANATSAAAYTYIIGAALATQSAGANALATAAGAGTADAYGTATNGFSAGLAATLATSNATVSVNVPAASDTAPAIAGTIANQTLTDQQTISPFARTSITDPDVGASERATLTVLVGGVASDATGTLSGAGLTKTGIGTYQLTTGTPRAVTTLLESLVFTPTSVGAGTGSTSITLLVSDGILSATDTTTSLIVSSGSGTGDVHMVTFQGLHYDFMAVGDYTLARSTGAAHPFDVQIRTAAWGDMASVTTKIAAQVGANALQFDLDGSVRLNGAVDTGLSAVGSVERFEGGTITRTASDSYAVSWSTGERLDVINRGPYFDETLTLSAKDGAGSVAGLLGTNTSQATDLQLADGTVLTNPTQAQLLGVYADSWAVADGQSLLNDNTGLPLALSNRGNIATPFDGKSAIDVAHFNAVGATLGFREDASGGFGTLTVACGSQQTSMILMGQYASENFGVTSDGHGGALVQYVAPKVSLLG